MTEYRYSVIYEPQVEGGFQVVFPAIPEIITYGESLEEARQMAADALRCHLEGLAKDGEAFPVEPGPLAAPVKEELAIAL
jgi:predicted RNase H-like HicB family nuclease